MIKYRFSLWALAFFLTISLAFAANAKIVKLTSADNSRQISINRGDMVSVKLEYNSGTGYLWKVKEIRGFQLEKQENFIPSGLPGAKSYQVFTFKSIKKGNGNITIAFLRPWEKNIPPLKIFKTDFKVI